MSSLWTLPSRAFENAKKQLQLEAIPAMDVMKAEAEVSKRDQDLTVARTNLQLQESLIKNALTRSLDDAALEEMPVVPTDRLQHVVCRPTEPMLDLINQALRNRPELLEIRCGSGKPTDQPQGRTKRVAASAFLGRILWRHGLGRRAESCIPAKLRSTVPTDLGGAIQNAFNNSSPDYYVGFNLNIPFRNRVAKADQYRSELEYRQSELARGATEKANSHRSPQCAICSRAVARPG